MRKKTKLSIFKLLLLYLSIYLFFLFQMWFIICIGIKQ